MMKVNRYETEELTEVWNNDNGSHYEIGFDRDGLGMIEIRFYDKDEHQSKTRMTFEKECALKIGEALKSFCLNKNKEDENDKER